MENFTPLESTIGGALIGVAAALLMLFHGRIAGISGVAGGLLSPKPGDLGWRVLFVAGLVVGGLAIYALQPSSFAIGIERSPVALVLAGLMVGFGTRLGSGCTSGHGVCGLSRLSPRSLAATLTFMATGMATAAVVTHLFGGTL